MTLPFTTNFVTIEEAGDSGDKWEPRTYTTSATGVPCVLGRVTSNTAQSTAGQQDATDLTLYVNVDVAVSTGARVTDEASGEAYFVESVHRRTGLNLDRLECELRRVEGISA